MNQVMLIGNLTRDPELFETSNDVTGCKLGLAVNRNYYDADGSRPVDFFNVVAWRTTAENCERFLKKGSKIAVVGSIMTRTYEDDDGNKHNAVDIYAEEIEFLSTVKQDDEAEEKKQTAPVDKKKTSAASSKFKRK